MGAPFRHMGGGVITDYGPISLADARNLAAFYLRESRRHPTPQAAERVCSERADALAEAVEQALRWRRAAGWLDPDAADLGPASPPLPRRA